MKTISIALVVLALLVGGYYLFAKDNTNIRETSSQNTSDQSKIDINVVCEGALAYMTFSDGEAAEKFVAECKAGEHPEVIEHYKAQLNLGAGAEI